MKIPSLIPIDESVESLPNPLIVNFDDGLTPNLVDLSGARSPVAVQNDLGHAQQESVQGPLLGRAADP